MSTPVRFVAFVLGLGAVFGAAVGVGSVTGPVGPAADEPAAAGHEEEPEGHGGATEGHGDGGHAAEGTAAPAGRPPAGLMVTEDGYTLDLDAATVPAAADAPVSFRILGPDGQPVRDYDESHDEDLHLIAVRRDLSGFQHVHPALDDEGVWRIPLRLVPGTWRLFADFVPAAEGENRILGADLAVPGTYTPTPLPEPAATAEVDGYSVTLHGGLVPGEESELALSVSRDGRPVPDLQPYLGAYGHLVVLRDGDLAYLHVHPAGEPGDGVTEPGPEVRFMTTAPSAGTYRLFLDFRHEDVVRTAEFTVSTTGKGTP
jgi:hypothetical protein